jgi:Matrixin
MSFSICRILQVTLIPIAIAVGFIEPASAYALFAPGNCHPGQKWDVSRAVKVRVLEDSVSDYAALQGTKASEVKDRMDKDIDAVLKLYNSVSGSRLTLERGASINGDKNLEQPQADDYGDQTIVIGFTDGTLTDTAEAETEPLTSKDGCTLTRTNIRFRKFESTKTKTPYFWVFGPPDNSDCDDPDLKNAFACRAFFTKDQPKPAGGLSPRTFLGILTHEMGHAVGLAHPDDNYAIMAQSFRTWFRGKNEVLHTALLPDDIAGVLALYEKALPSAQLDISVTNTWYKSDADEIPFACKAQIQAASKALKALEDATGLSNDRKVPTSDSDNTSSSPQDDTYKLLEALTAAEHALQACKDGQNADQIDHCRISSRADDWADKVAGADKLCGLNAAPSAYPNVSEQVCSGKQVQLRYTLNNHTKLRSASVKTEVWFSSDMALKMTDGSDVQSPDVRETTIAAATSAPIGQVFRLPAKVPADAQGRTYVFVRAVPFDAITGTSLLDIDSDQSNNAIMVRHYIKVISCSS